jgi:two-component system, chemotaxis family, protein-glutamate methylesterase/glutaminase
VEADRRLGRSAAHRDLVVIGASAGGVEVLTRVVRDLPADLRAAVCIVLHIAPGSRSMLADILGRAGRLPCRPARDGERLRQGVVLVAPPDNHLAIEEARVRLIAGPRENGHRPAIDVLFRSAAAALDSRVVGVVLSGNRDDGSAGLAAIKASGGAAIVQDPNEAMYGGMPASAIAKVAVDAVVPSGLVASTIAATVNGEKQRPGAGLLDRQPDRPERDQTDPVCPECGAVLTQRAEDGVLRWECRVGHRYPPETLIDARDGSAEAALWAAIRAVTDRGASRRRGAQQAERFADHGPVLRFRRQSQTASEQADAVHQTLARPAGTSLSRVADTDGDDHPAEEADTA